MLDVRCCVCCRCLKVHNNLKRLVRKGKLQKFADLSDALPSDIRKHLNEIENRSMVKFEASPDSYSRRSKMEILASPRSAASDHDASSSCSPSRHKSMTMSASDILTKIFDENQDDERAFMAERSANLMNLYRGWDGAVGIVILMESIVIWFRLCFYSAYRDDAQFKDSFIFWSLVTEYVFEALFVVDIFWMKLRALPAVLGCTRIESRTFSFYWDALMLCPFELLLVFPAFLSAQDLTLWMVWCRAPKLLRLRSFQWTSSTEAHGERERNETKADSTELYQYSSSLQDRLTNLEKFMSSLAVPIFLWRYMSFVATYFVGGHIMGGLWFVVGVWGQSYYSMTWIIRDRSSVFEEGYDSGGPLVVSLYLRSIYFCLNAMTTTGYGDISCTNPLETVLLVILIIVSIIMFASMVGLFQNKTMEKDAHLARFQLQIEYTKSFMKRHRISAELHKRVLQHFEYVWNRSKGVDEAAVLGSLPASLRGDIVLFMNRGFITKVRWFKNCTRGFIRSLATRLEQHLFLPQETIFQSGSMGQHMFFINEGVIAIELDHDQQHQHDHGHDRPHSLVLKSGEFFGHQSIIEMAPRTYTAVAGSVCELLSLSMRRFNELLEYEPELPQMLQDEDAIAHFRDSVRRLDDEEMSSSDELDTVDSDIEIRIQGMGRSINSSPKFNHFMNRRKGNGIHSTLRRRRSLDSRRASYSAIPSASSAAVRRRKSDVTIGLPQRRRSSISVSRGAANTFRTRSASDFSGIVSPSKVQMTARRCSVSGFHEIDPRRDSNMSMQASLDVINSVRRRLGAHSKMGQSLETSTEHLDEL